MTRYAKYENAKIAYPKSMILVRNGYFDAMENIATSQINMWEECDPREHCITVKQFLDCGNKFVDGDILLTNERTSVRVIGTTYERDDMSASTCNKPDDDIDVDILVLKAAALESKMNIDTIATQTPEEKEAFDLIDTTPHQYEMSKLGGEKPEWKNGDECVICGEKLIYIGESIEADIHCVQEFGTCIYRNAHISVIEKPENPEAKEKREKLEAAYDLHCDVNKSVGTVVCSSFELFKSDEVQVKFWLAIVDKTNYRKGE